MKGVLYVCPPIRMQIASCSMSHLLPNHQLPPIHPPHTTINIELQSPPNITHLTSHWPTEDSVSKATHSRLHPPSHTHTLFYHPPVSPSTPPPHPGTDHMTFRKGSPSSPLLLLTLSWSGRRLRLPTVDCLHGSSPLKGKSLISLEAQSSA